MKELDDRNYSNCKIVDEPTGLTDRESRDLSFYHLSIRSLPAHLEEFESYVDQYLDQHNTNIIGLCETWLSLQNEHLYSLSNYRCISNSRTVQMGGGGVALYLPWDTHNHVRNDLGNLFNELAEAVFIEIKIGHLSGLIIGEIYQPP